MESLTFFFFLVTIIIACNLADAYKFIPGGRDGWVLHPSEDYTHWAGRNRFLINDSINFKYKKGEDSVLLVTAEDYSSCNTNNPIQKWDDGDTVFQFDRSGPFYFISGTDGHCQQGQKLIVVVLAVRRPPSVPSPTSAPPPEAIPPATSSPPAPSASPPATSSPPAPEASPPAVSPANEPSSSVPSPSSSTSPSGSETANSPAADVPANASPPPPSSASIAGGGLRLWASVAAGIVVVFVVVRG